MDNEISVTIITVCFNSKHTIEQTLLSVLNQIHRPLQYILIDGNSTDGTQSLLTEYGVLFEKKGIQFSFVSEKDSGIADAFNKGLVKARGRMIGFLNADDRFFNESVLQKAVRLFVDDETIVCGSILLEQPNGSQRKLNSRPERLSTGMYVLHPASLVPKKLVDSVGFFDTTLKIAMDFDFFTRLKKQGAKFKTNNDTVSTIMLDGGASSNARAAGLEELYVKNKHYGERINHYLHYYYSTLIRFIVKLRSLK